jgi:hypothetical protein
VIARWVGPERIVAIDGVPVADVAYESSVSYQSMPVFQGAPAGYSYQSMPFYNTAPAATYGGGGLISGGAAPLTTAAPTTLAGPQLGQGGGSPIYIDARSTLEHGPRFGIGGGLFRSGDTYRARNSGGGLFGRRAQFSGTSYAAGMVCGPNGCSAP